MASYICDIDSSLAGISKISEMSAFDSQSLSSSSSLGGGNSPVIYDLYKKLHLILTDTKFVWTFK